MYFKQIDEIISGKKTMTRRIVKPDELGMYLNGDYAVFTYTHGDPEQPRLKWQVGHTYAVSPGRGKPGVWWQPIKGPYVNWADPKARIVGFENDIVVPDSDQGRQEDWRPLRIRITQIRRERLQEINASGALAEGITEDYPLSADLALDRNGYVARYAALWDTINTRKGMRWQDNPAVWVLTFEVVK